MKEKVTLTKKEQSRLMVLNGVDERKKRVLDLAQSTYVGFNTSNFG
jgi:hypothetical protein